MHTHTHTVRFMGKLKKRVSYHRAHISSLEYCMLLHIITKHCRSRYMRCTFWPFTALFIFTDGVCLGLATHFKRPQHVHVRRRDYAYYLLTLCIQIITHPLFVQQRSPFCFESFHTTLIASHFVNPHLLEIAIQSINHYIVFPDLSHCLATADVFWKSSKTSSALPQVETMFQKIRS